MSFNLNDCWYKDVCPKPDCCGVMCIRYDSMKFLMDNSGIPKSKQCKQNLMPDKRDFKAFKQLAAIKEDIEQFVVRGENLYITSSITGNGKTSWSLKLLMNYFDKIWAGSVERVRGMFVHVPTVLLQFKDFENPLDGKYKTNLMNADVVVWDDIASTKHSQYDLTVLTMLLDSRLFHNKSNIYTGNIPDYSSLEEILGSRLASRIYNSSTVIEFVGSDRRNDTITSH